jgi:solute carrier family 25 iron transporter 28/37
MAREGWRAFYYSFGTQLILNIPYQSLHFVVYEFVQDMVNPERRYMPLSHVASGAAAGAVAAALTTPFDVCKTLLNTQESGAVAQHGRNVHGIVSAATTVYALKGFKGFFSGTSARVLFQIPSTAIAWFVYEFFKYALKKQWHIHHPEAASSAEHHSVPRIHLATSGEIHGTVPAALGVAHVSAARNN